MSDYPIISVEDLQRMDTGGLLEHISTLTNYIEWRRDQCAKLNDKECSPGEYRAEWVRIINELRDLRNFADHHRNYVKQFDILLARTEAVNKDLQSRLDKSISSNVIVERQNKVLRQQYETTQRNLRKPKTQQTTRVKQSICVSSVDTHLL